MKKANIILFILILGLSGCNNNQGRSQSDNITSAPHESSRKVEVPATDSSLHSEAPDSTGQSEVVENIIQPIKVADGFYDIGKSLFPNEETRFSGRILDDDCILVTTLAESVIYNYQTGEVLHRLSLPIERLGMEHFYSHEQISESKYTISLYDRSLNVLAQHESDRPAIPVIDGKTILYNQYDQRKQIITLNTETGEEKAFNFIALQPNDGTPYEGSIWVRSFDGENVFFSTTCNPNSVNPGIGVVNIMTGEGLFSTDFSTTEFPEFSGIPDLYGENKAIFWQDGSAYGTDGTYCIVMDAAKRFFTIVDVGTTACRISDSGEYLVAVSSAWNADTKQVVLTNISTYHAHTSSYDHGPFELISSKDWGIESLIESDYGSGFSGISISDDGKYICFSGITQEDGDRRQTLFLYKAERD